MTVHAPAADMERTGERVILGRSDRAGEEYELEHIARYEFARAYVLGQIVVDVACGTGYGTAILSSAGATSVTGYDIDEETVAFAEREWGSSQARFRVADAATLPEADSSVDLVVSFETIEHLSNPVAFIQEMARILRPGGLLVLSTPDRDVYNWADHVEDGGNPFHVSEMAPRELVRLLRKDFKILEMLGQTPVQGYPSLLRRLWRKFRSAVGLQPQAWSHRHQVPVSYVPRRWRGPVKYRLVVAKRAAHGLKLD